MDGATLRYSIYLPPSYYSEPDSSFPVVYLLHGINSTGDSFVNVDQIEQRMNEWIEDGSITEMIVVMPNSGKRSGYEDTAGGPNDSQGPWASHIYVDILNQIETNYRAIPDAGFRGFSREGRRWVVRVTSDPPTPLFTAVSRRYTVWAFSSVTPSNQKLPGAPLRAAENSNVPSARVRPAPPGMA